MSPIRSVVGTLAAALAICAVMCAQALGFGTIRGGPGDQRNEHMHLTRLALQCGAPLGTVLPDCFDPGTLDALAGTPTNPWDGVGWPDNPPPQGATFHCDDGDFVQLRPRQGTYGQTQQEAQAAFTRCRNIVVSRLETARDQAEALLDARSRIDLQDVALPCNFARPFTFGPTAKCRVLAHIGAALHVAQDFYSHSNWSDAPPPRQTDQNPNGLDNIQVAPFLDMGVKTPAFPTGLVSGCFSPAELTNATVGGACLYFPLGMVVTTPGSFFPTPGPSAQRLLHASLAKDEGTIDETTGLIASDDRTSARGKAGAPGRDDNFTLAAKLAASETQRKWQEFRQMLVNKYGKKAKRIICALTRDDPAKSCKNISIALVIDASGSNTTTDPQNLRLAASSTLVTDLVAQEGQDAAVAVVSFEDSATLLYPLGDPTGALPSINGIRPGGGTAIASGVRAGLAALSAQGAPTPGTAGILVFTDGEDADISGLVAAIDAATAQGVRVSFGFLSPPGASAAELTRSPVRRAHAAPSSSLQDAILRSGGVFATIGSAADQTTFVSLVEQRGLAAIDAQNAGGGGPIGLNLEVAGVARSVGANDVWLYQAGSGEGVQATLTPAAAGSGLTLEVKDALGGVAQAGGDAAAGGRAVISAQATQAGALRFVVSSPNAGARYTLRLTPAPGAAPLPVPQPPRSPFRPISSVTRFVNSVRLSLVRAGPRVRFVPRGGVANLAWILSARTRTAFRVKVKVTGPGGVRQSVTGVIPVGRQAIRVQIPVIGSRRGAWTVVLTVGGLTVSRVRVPVR